MCEISHIPLYFFAKIGYDKIVTKDSVPLYDVKVKSRSDTHACMHVEEMAL